MGAALTTAPDRVPIRSRSTQGQVLPAEPRHRALTRFGAFDVEGSIGDVTVGDPYGIAWGAGDSLEAALRDWESAAREIYAVLSSRPVSPQMARRREILRHWFG